MKTGLPVFLLFLVAFIKLIVYNKRMKNLPKIALIGRTNVGKSTLFNRLIEEYKALTSPEPGTTRDRNFGVVSWRDKEFTLIDTGGLDLGYLPKTKLPKKLVDRVSPEDFIEVNIVKQAEIAIKQADFILMITDGQVGLQPEDQTVASIIKKADKPCQLIVNKVDKLHQRNDIWEFQKLGLGDPIPVSGATGIGTGDMLDILIKKIKFPRGRKAKEQKIDLKIAIIGKPNVGKSSLLNAILGEERVIVSPMPHTTREAQDADFLYQDKLFTLIDTAGIRRHAKIQQGLEKAGVNDSLLNLKRSDVALLVVETQKPLNVQDAKLAQEIVSAKCGLIIVANKWDLIDDKDVGTQNKFIKYFRDYFPSLSWAPIVFISAKSGQRVKTILDLALEIEIEREKTILDKELYKLLKTAIKKHLPGQAKGMYHPHIYSLTQVGSRPPRFELLIHPKAEVHFSYVRYLENQIRRQWGFLGTPLIVHQKFHKK